MNLLKGTMKKIFLDELNKIADSPMYPTESNSSVDNKTVDEAYYGRMLGKDPNNPTDKGYYYRSKNDIVVRK
jgi:hypothetical protein